MTRLAVYTDYEYHRVDGEIYAERAFALFLARLAHHFEQFTVIGRLAPGAERGRYPLSDRVNFVPLPYYARLSEPLPVLRAMWGSFRAYWRALGETDCVWLLGPHPLCFLFAPLAMLRRKRVVLGVRQDLPEYVRSRHPQSRLLRFASTAMELGYRFLGRFCSVIAVGPELARKYGRSRRVLELTVSLVPEREIVEPARRQTDYGNELRVLSVGRLDAEKNPLLLADILARLHENDIRWRLVVCGEGALREQLQSRLAELGLGDAAELRGYVSHQDLGDLYARCHILLHVSWTEGLPQVLYEAFAAALPVVATDVGGVAAAVDGAASLVPPGDADAGASALRTLSEDAALRARLVEAGHDLVRTATIEAESQRVAEFLGGHQLAV